MAKNLHLRNLPERVYEQLALRADLEGRSLNQQVIVELRRRFEAGGGGEGRRQVLERMGCDLEAGGGRRLSPPPEELVRADRER